jgi:hypothetical protein
VDGVMASEDSTAPAEHSPELKSAIEDYDNEEPELYGGKPVIVVHEPHPLATTLKWIFWFIVSVGLALLALNFLLDAGVVSVGRDLPHTNLLEP